MTSVAELAERALRGERLWGWQWWRLRTRAEVTLVDALIDRLAASTDPAARQGHLSLLCWLVADLRFRRQLRAPAVIQRLLALVRAETSPDALWYFRDLLGHVRREAGEALLALLADRRTALPVKELLFGVVSQAFRDDAVGRALRGDKALLVELVSAGCAGAWDRLRPLLGAADTPLLAKLVRDPTRPWQERTQAAVCWQSLAGDAVGPDVAALVVELPVMESFDADERRALYRQLAGLGPGLCAPVAARLASESLEERLRAARFLQLVGEPAIPVLSELVRTTPDWHVRQNAEEALRAISRPALDAALAQRAADDRSLSPAAPPPTSAERGLSRGGERHDA